MRLEQFHIDVVDIHGNVTRALNPTLGGSITCTAGQTVARTLTGLSVPADQTIDQLTERLRVVAVIDGTEHSLGTFLVTVAATHHTDYGDVLEIHGQDLGYLLLQSLLVPYGVVLGASVSDAITDLAVLAGVLDTNIPETGAVTGAYLAWPPGTALASVMNDLCRLASLTPPFFDRTGTLVARHIPYAGVDAPAFTFTGSYVPGAAEVDDLWDKPTDWLVISKSTDAAYSGSYSLPETHPLAASARGYRQVATFDIPGLTSDLACEQRARDEAQLSSYVHRSAQIDVTPQPDLEPWDVVTWRDRDWVTESFTLDLSIGATQQVSVRESLGG